MQGAAELRDRPIPGLDKAVGLDVNGPPDAVHVVEPFVDAVVPHIRLRIWGVHHLDDDIGSEVLEQGSISPALSSKKRAATSRSRSTFSCDIARPVSRPGQAGGQPRPRRRSLRAMLAF